MTDAFSSARHHGLLCMGLFSIFFSEIENRVRQISFNPFKLACPRLPTMMWSCTEIPSGVAMSTIARVIWMSACEGVGSPEGWLCTNKLK
jgi:hypothetical protein